MTEKRRNKQSKGILVLTFEIVIKMNKVLSQCWPLVLCKSSLIDPLNVVLTLGSQLLAILNYTKTSQYSALGYLVLKQILFFTFERVLNGDYGIVSIFPCTKRKQQNNIWSDTLVWFTEGHIKFQTLRWDF